MRYVLFVCAPGDGEPGPRESADDPRLASYIGDARGREVVRGGARLRPPADATSVRVRDGEVLIGDGPFMESPQHIAGFDLIEVADLDEAVSLAACHPAARSGGSVEVRPVWE
ncbi:YciI family protein [Streptomyces sp. NPDC086783]|uniref:YciI family protein n=1 Tax=Streptomyces sp. NPDC086783 TaxID=3365758 RepID=UPI0038288F0F